MTIDAIDIDVDGTTTAHLTVTDGAGVPLDMSGLLTEGAFSADLVLAYQTVDQLGQPDEYRAITTRLQTNPGTGETATQGSVDGGGQWTVTDVRTGRYAYRFAVAADPANAALTHSVAAVARRVYRDREYRASAMGHVRPDGDSTLSVRDVVTDTGCSSCHGQVRGHQGSMTGVASCVLCHNQGSSDPDTGHTLALGEMVHKIHRGRDLALGYQLVGDGQETHDYATVAYPRDLRSCTACHDGSQGNRWQTRPGRLACGACHDDTSFVDPPAPGQVLHIGGPQANDDNCTVCHPAQGGVAGVLDMHLTPLIDPASPELALEILSVDQTAGIIDLRFAVTVDGAPYDIVSAPLPRLRATVAGPTSDYREYFQVTMQGGGSSGTLVAENAAAGIFRYTFPASAALPVDAIGTYAVALEAYITASDGTRLPAFTPIGYVAVTDPTPVPRRQIVEAGKCNSCHDEVREHGGVRENVAYCAMCHNAMNSNDERAPRPEGQEILAESVDLKVMIHRIHQGHQLTGPYVLGGFPAPSTGNPWGTPADFSEVRFPRATSECVACHTPGTEQLPLAESALPSLSEWLACIEDPAADGDDYCDTRVSTPWYTPPTSAVCTSCHDGTSTAAHAEVMTTVLGVESCLTCHGPDAAFDATPAHAGL